MLQADKQGIPQLLTQAVALHRQGQTGQAKNLYQRVLQLQPALFDALHLLGVIAIQEQDYTQAQALLAQAIAVNPAAAEAYYHHGIALLATGDYPAAADSLAQAVRLNPGHAGARAKLADACFLAGQYDKALNGYLHRLSLNPGAAETHFRLGQIYQALNQHQNAITSYGHAIGLNPDFAEAHCARGMALSALGRREAALLALDQAIRLNPQFVEAIYNRALALSEQQRFSESLPDYRQALALKPDFAAGYLKYGNVLHLTQQPEAALNCYAKAIALQPEFADAYFHRGNALYDLASHAQAIESYNRALELDPEHADAYNRRGLCRQAQDRHDLALPDFEAAIRLRPDFAEAHCNLGYAYSRRQQADAAYRHYQIALNLSPDIDFLYGNWLQLKMQICDWDSLETACRLAESKIRRHEKACPAFNVLAFSGDPALHQTAAEILIRSLYPAKADLPPPRVYPEHAKIRIAYFSADFRDHATAYLTANLFENHDKQRFELYAMSLGPETQDSMRARLESSFDCFLDIRHLTDLQAAQLSRDLEIDVAIDLGGHTTYSRPGIFAYRTAPVQINYLGYPGTMAAEYMDYIIADACVIPPENRPYFTESVIYMPHAYQVNDPTRELAGEQYTRADCGLPEQGFVFCSFNNNYKINPETFDSWMRILRRVESSVLWLIQDNPRAAANLKQQAKRRGVSADRLILSERIPQIRHLARQTLAGLFLDSLPYNAHTTASDALWAGLPVLTLIGTAFPGRVAASLLTALNLPELITRDRAEFENLAVELAQDTEKLAQIRAKLQQRRLDAPLFDCRSFTRRLEAAYLHVHQRSLNGLKPADAPAKHLEQAYEEIHPCKPLTTALHQGL